MIDRAKITRNLNTTAFQPEIYVESETDSTNSYSKRLLHAGLESDAVVIAERQIAGIGRSNRPWHSPLGGLYMSLVIQKRNTFPIFSLYSFALAISASKVLEELTSLQIGLKWPNDLQASGKKIGGILSELVTDNPERFAIILGIGLNLNDVIANFPIDLQKTVTSTLSETGNTVDIEHVASEIINSLDYRLKHDPNFEQVIDDYRPRCTSLGKHVTVQLSDSSFTGYVLDINERGSLLVRDLSGKENLLSAGEVIHLDGA